MVKLTKSGSIRINFRSCRDNQIKLRCNFDCSYCIRKFKRRRLHDFIKRDYLKTKEIWDKLTKIEDKIYARIIFDGELLINKWTRECVFYMSKLPNMEVLEIVTNNSINPKHYLSSLNLEKTSFSCSFHPEYISIQKFLKHIHILKTAGCHVYANIVCIPQIVKFIPKIINLFKKYDIILKLQAFMTPDIRYLVKKYPEAYNIEERKILKKFFINKEEYEFFVEKKSTKGLLCYAGVDMLNLFLDGTIRRCFTGKICEFYKYGGVKNNLRGNFSDLFPNKFRDNINTLTDQGVFRFLSRKIKKHINDEIDLDDLISGKIKLQRKAFPCHKNECLCTAHLIGLKHIRDKFLLSNNFVGMYNLTQIS